MSLIERALNKARDGAVPGTAESGVRIGLEIRPPAPPNPVPSREPAPRVVANPELRITDELLGNAGLLAPHDQHRQVTNEYRHIKRRLLAEIHAGTANRLTLMASALSGEGKSFSSTNLAFSLALEPDFTVVLVDADVIKPNLTRVFGLLDRKGLLDAAADSTLDVESLIVSTNIEGLSLLPAGRMNANATEYFASHRMQEVVNDLLAVPNRLLVVDSLPLLMTTEARALVPLAGQVVLVVRAESTPRQAVDQALDLLGEDANVKLILNAMVRTKAQAYVGYGYYGYDYNYGEDAAAAKKVRSKGMRKLGWLLLPVVGAAPVLGQDARLDYELRAGVAYSDNAERIRANPTETTIAVAGASVRGAREEGRLQYALAGDASYLDYMESDLPNEVVGSLFASSSYDILPQSVRWTLDGSFSPDPRGSAALSRARES